MTLYIALDSGPLGLLMQRRGVPVADACRAWAAERIAAGRRFIVPEIADYEVRRELIRLNATAAIARLDAFLANHTYVPIDTAAMRMAAEHWAKVRASGMVTADRHALDGDAIVAAQLLSAGSVYAGFIVATANVKHLSRFVPAELWDRIR